MEEKEPFLDLLSIIIKHPDKDGDFKLIIHGIETYITKDVAKKIVEFINSHLE